MNGVAIRPRPRIIARQAMFDLRLLLRNGEQVLLTLRGYQLLQ